MPNTHVVTSLVPPLENYNPASSPVSAEALIREGGQWGAGRGHRTRRALGQPGRRNSGASWPTATADPAHPRPVRPPCRRGRIRPGVPRADEGRGRPRTAAPGPTSSPAPHVVRAAKTSVWTPERPHLPDLDDLCRRPGAAFQPPAGRGLRKGPLLASPRIRPELKVPTTKAGITAGMSMTEKQGGSDDFMPGPPSTTRNADGSYTLTGHEVVHLGPDV